MSATELLVWGVVAHLIADWLLQNSYLAVNKGSLRHPAAWIHSGIHFGLLSLVFSWPVAGALAVSHLLIDTRIPRAWWAKTFRQTTDGAMGVHVAIWADQVMHVVTIAVAAALAASNGHT